VSLTAEDNRTGTSAFSVVSATLYKGIAQFGGYSGVSPLLQRAATLAQNDRERGYHTLAAEITMGVARGAKHWSFEDTRSLVRGPSS
jgi:hypothetical protein